MTVTSQEFRILVSDLQMATRRAEIFLRQIEEYETSIASIKIGDVTVAAAPEPVVSSPTDSIDVDPGIVAAESAVETRPVAE